MKEAYDTLREQQQSTLLNPSDTAIREESEAFEKWLHIAGIEESFLKQRAKLH